MTFERGTRVMSGGDFGTITEVIRQKHTSDLFRIAWDRMPEDHDLYSDAHLTIVTSDNIVSPWTSAPEPQARWAA